MNYVLIAFQVLFAEVLGVGVIAGILYLYWEILTKKRK